MFAGLCFSSLLVVFLFIFLFFRGFFFVSLRLLRRRLFGLERQREDAIRRVVVIALIELSDARIEVASRNEIKILAVTIENRIVIVVEAGGNFGNLLGAERVEEDIVGAAAVGL